jgi:hypothetical protein
MTSTITLPASPPEGYRWAREDEIDRPDAIMVPLTVDSNGTPYTGDEADIAVPIFNGELDARRELARAIEHANTAINALDEEHERDFREALERLALVATELDAFAKGM